ncbi:MAG TPA: aspartate carbamoyltransferase, partial [bacterium]|nr:aspartate carbamoyltransferase [bacterium]
MELKSRHLLGLKGMSAEEIELILETALSFKEVLNRPVKKVPTLQGFT